MTLRDQLNELRKTLDEVRSLGAGDLDASVDKALKSLDDLARRIEERQSGPASSPVCEQGAIATQQRVVLVAEDDAPARRVMLHLLDHAGYQVIEADSGASALQAALYHEGNIDLLLSDLIMPDFDGVALADQIRDIRPGIRVLFMSGFDAAELQRQDVRLDHPSETLLRKPFRREVLLETLANMLK